MEKNRRGFLGVLMAAAFTGIATRATPKNIELTPYVAPEDMILSMDRATGQDMTGVVYYSDGEITHVSMDVSIDLSDGADQTIETWYTDGKWHHFQQVRKDGVMTMHLDGVQVSYLPDSFVGWGKNNEPALFVETVHGNFRELDFAEVPSTSMVNVMTPTGNLVLRDGKLRASP